MREVEPVAEALDDADQVVVGPHADGAGAEGEAVVDRVVQAAQEAQVLLVLTTRGMAEQRARRIVGMDRELDPRDLGDRGDGADK